MKNLLNQLLGRYKTHNEAIVISCFFNPTNSQYRLDAFDKWYQTIKHLNYKIIECVIGNGSEQLSKYNDPNITVINTPNLLWHKESILNKIISDLPQNFKYVFWLDADIIFSNKKWLIDGVKQLQNCNIIQPFEFAIHLDKDETINNHPSVDVDYSKTLVNKPQIGVKLWRSFAATYVESQELSKSNSYEIHGFVGFAWGARREILNAVPLYDKALIGGADHIVAHAAAGQIPHNCIIKSFKDNIQEINTWSKKFYQAVKGKIGYVEGDLYHIWHGDIAKRQYLKRIQDFTPRTKNIVERDRNGLFIAPMEEPYIASYFNQREVTNSPINIPTPFQAGGGDFGGGGSTASYDDSNPVNDTIKGVDSVINLGGGSFEGNGASVDYSSPAESNNFS